MDIKKIKSALSEYDAAMVDVYASYLTSVSTQKNRDKTLKNPWFKYKTDEDHVSNFKKVNIDGLYFDGVHITLQSTGVSYDYIAYKKKMLLVYPEALFDHALVYKDDTFKFEKQSGNVTYSHQINNPFNQSEKDIIGGYCIIKTKRGAYITLLSATNIAKHRKVAKTDGIWKAWFHEMCLKTLIKKACKQHFEDIYQNIETIDNENYDLEKSISVDIDDKSAIEKINTVEDLRKYWVDNNGRNARSRKEFDKLLADRKVEIEDDEKENDERDIIETVCNAGHEVVKEVDCGNTY